ncbi:flagellar export chaperone FliS [Priestia filamentosa]|uniref:flagellar export chaperone FliS n=1 Tax=Priestia filamentosa TaxID=1402861 RepID=UPI000588E9A6
MSGYNIYRENEIMTNHPVENTILMYESCISRLRFIKKGYESFKFSKADEQIERVEQMVEELKLQVDESVDIELAELLYGLYEYVLDGLYKVSKFRTTEPIPGMEKVFMDLIEGFKGAMKIEEGK